MKSLKDICINKIRNNSQNINIKTLYQNLPIELF